MPGVFLLGLRRGEDVPRPGQIRQQSAQIPLRHGLPQGGEPVDGGVEQIVGTDGEGDGVRLRYRFPVGPGIQGLEEPVRIHAAHRQGDETRLHGVGQEDGEAFRRGGTGGGIAGQPIAVGDAVSQGHVDRFFRGGGNKSRGKDQAQQQAEDTGKGLHVIPP